MTASTNWNSQNSCNQTGSAQTALIDSLFLVPAEA